MLASWSAYALAGAGLGLSLPLLRPVLVAITAVYLARVAALPAMVRMMPDRSRRFLLASSAVVLAIGTVHAIGLVTAWPRL